MLSSCNNCLDRLPRNVVIICLALFMATGLILNILACALWKNWWPIIVVVTYLIAPLPNIIFARCQHDPLGGSGNNSWKDTGYFLTSMLMVSGFALPAVLAHVEAVQIPALFLALLGGIIVYGTVVLYSYIFTPREDEF